MANEKRTGFSSKFKFDCSKCEEGAEFCTSKLVVNSNSRAQHQLHEANVTASYGMLNIGRGAGDAFSCAASMNIPLDRECFQKIYYRAEDYFGKAMEMVTNKALGENMKTYIAAAAVAAAAGALSGNLMYLRYKTKLVNGVEYVPIIGSVDGCWDKRASGHSYSSNHGSVTLWGHLPDGRNIPLMICQYQIRCYACNVWRGNNLPDAEFDTGRVPPEIKERHNCRENHRDSDNNPWTAKSMEAQGAVDMGLAAIAQNMFISVLVMDDDSSIPAAMCVTGTNKVKAAAGVCRMPAGLEVQWILGDPSHRLRTQGNEYFKLANMGRLPGEVRGDSRFTKVCAGQFKKYAAAIMYAWRAHGKETGDWSAAEAGYKEATMQALEHAFGRHTAEDSRCDTACKFGCPALADPAYVPTFEHNLVGVNGSMGFRYLRGETLYNRLKRVQVTYSSDYSSKQVINPPR